MVATRTERFPAVVSGERAAVGLGRSRGGVPAPLAFSLHGAAKESNLPSAGLPRPAGFEDEWLPT